MEKTYCYHNSQCAHTDTNLTFNYGYIQLDRTPTLANIIE